MNKRVAVAALMLMIAMIGLGLMSMVQVYCVGVMNGWYAAQYRATGLTLSTGEWDQEMKMCYNDPFLLYWCDQNDEVVYGRA